MLGLVDEAGHNEEEHREVHHRGDYLLVATEERAVGAQPRNPASKRSWQAAPKTRSKLCLRNSRAGLWNGWVKVALGEPEAAIECAERAMRLSPQDPQSFSIQTAIACAHLVAGRYEDALSAAEVAMRAHPDHCLDLLLQAMEIVLPGLYLDTMGFVPKAGEASIPVA